MKRLLLFLLAAASAHAQTATQDVTLSAGWNAVWLDVEPTFQTGPDLGQRLPPQDAFANPAIELVATPKPLAGLAEFFGTDPATLGTFNQDEWLRWKRTDPSASNNLALVDGNRPYLIQVTAGTPTFTLSLTGKARFFRPTWVPDRYNLVGFALEGTHTFQSFFGPSGTKHPVARIFRLNAAGNWQGVTGAATMVSHQAYWVFASGPSRYMGPVSVDFDLATLGDLNFGGPADERTVGSGLLDLKEIVLTNVGTVPAVPEMDLIVGSADLALHVVRPAASGLAYDRGDQVDASPGVGSTSPLGETVAPQGTATLTLGAERLWADGTAGRTNLYRLKTGAGASFWLPVSAMLSEHLTIPTDLLPSATAGVAGLWVGDVSVNAATSIVENIPSVKPTHRGLGPLRVLLHSDAGGAVRLLSQVTIMQTKTADPEVPPTQVLILDPAKIPFFEGVQERNGKRVGIRIATVTYDMPRDTSIAAQGTGSGDLIDRIVAESGDPQTKWAAGAGLYPDRASVTAAAIESYLQFRSTRPPTLKESYLRSLPVTGALGPGKTVRTAAGTLTLDPFHRSNPFRHAFHQGEGRGPQITREFEIVFDPAQSVSDHLRGTSTETLTGLTKGPLTVTGTLELRRLSPVAVLDAAP